MFRIKIALSQMTFITACVSIVSAQRLDQSLEEKTGMPANEFLQSPKEAANKIATNYFMEVMNKKNDGTPLTNFEIIKVNSQDLIFMRLRYPLF
jgi:hypothetical protein